MLQSVPNSIVFIIIDIVFVLTKSADPGQMHQFSAFHLGLHFLSMYAFMSFLFAHVNLRLMGELIVYQ